MKNKDFIILAEQHKQELSTILEIDILKDDIQCLKKENEDMFKFFQKLFKSDDNQEIINSLKQKNKALDGQLHELQTTLTQKQNSHNQLLKEVNTLHQKLQEIQNEQQNDLLLELNTYFDTFDEVTKLGVQNILKTTQKTSLLLSGVLNIDSLWHYTAYLRQEHKDDAFDKLKVILMILLEEYRQIEDIKLQDVSIGDTFDEELHTRDNRSDEMDGEVHEVLLQGFSRNGNIVKKSIVRVG